MFERILSINLTGVFLCARLEFCPRPQPTTDFITHFRTALIHVGYQYAARQMVKQGRGGRIIGACSIAGKQELPMGSAYCASKFAVRGLTQSLGKEYI